MSCADFAARRHLGFNMDKIPDSQWQPTTVQWDRTDFAVELPPVLERQHDHDPWDEQYEAFIDSLLSDSEHDYSDEIYHGFRLKLINERYTLSLDMIIKQDPPEVGFIPDRIESKPGRYDNPTIASVYTDGRVFEAVYELQDTKEELAQQIRRIKLSTEVQTKSGKATADAHIFEQRGWKNHRLDNAPYRMPTWKCHFEGGSFDMPDEVGSVLLIHLAKNRGQEFKADDLVRAIRGTTVLAGTTGAMSDNEALANGFSISEQATGGTLMISQKDLAKLQAEHREINRQIGEIGDNPGLQTGRADLERRRDELEEHVRKLTRPGAYGPQPRIAGSDVSRAANLIGKQIRRVLEALEKLDAGCHEHFANKLVLTFGKRCEYSKNHGHIWDIHTL